MSAVKRKRAHLIPNLRLSPGGAFFCASATPSPNDHAAATKLTSSARGGVMLEGGECEWIWRATERGIQNDYCAKVRAERPEIT
jgi:hypothetical protein